jgi:glycosyltransferase involved in cell wall biosynthesis
LDVPFPLFDHGELNHKKLRELLCNCNVMLCPEEDAGWSNPAAEAMACGLPLVCTEAGTSDFAIHGETALVVPNRQPKEMAIAALELFEDRKLSNLFREAGLEKIEEFSWQRVARNLLDTFNIARKDINTREQKNMKALSKINKLMN